jgi:hypothetical protein
VHHFIAALRTLQHPLRMFDSLPFKVTPTNGRNETP